MTLAPSLRPTRGALALAAVLLIILGVHAAFPTGLIGDGSYLLGTVGAAVAAWIWARRVPHRSRAVPMLVAAGLTASALADIIWAGYDLFDMAPDVSVADIGWLASYLAFGAALLVPVVRGRAGERRIDVEAGIDALTIVTVSVLLLWNVSVASILADDSVSSFTRMVWASYPVCDAILLALVARVLTNRTSRQTSGAWFALGGLCWLVADLGYFVLTVEGAVSVALDLLWMLGAALIALANRRAPMTGADSDHQPTESASHAGLGRVGIAILPLLVPAMLELLDVVQGQAGHPVQTVVGTAVLVLLALARTARLLRSESAARAQLASARDAAIAGLRAKSDFLATMSHEIRTPLNGVIGLSGLLLTTELDPRQQQYTDGIRLAGNSLMTLISDILDFSKIEAGRLVLETIDFNVLEVVEESAELLAEAAQSKGLELLAYGSPELPLALRGDPSRIRQVLVNLVANAVKFTAEGEVIVRAELAESAGSGLVVRFEVTDTGIGVAEDERHHLFDAFTQADASTTRRYGGSGLGLAICRQLVLAMGGSIGVESTVGTGSTFWFTLPLELAENPSVVSPAPQRNLAGMRVLVVDDNETNRLILNDQLEAWGVQVATAEDGPTALALMTQAERRGRPFTLAILDLCMPDMDGLDLAGRIMGTESLAGTPLFLLTSRPDVTAEEARAAGIVSRMTKPVHRAELQAALSAAAGMAPVERGRVGDDRGTPQPRGRLLVVDDSELNQLVAAGMAAKFGFESDVVDNGLEAVTAVERASYDAVLMDCQMPIMDGYEATEKIRRSEAAMNPTHRTPIIAMTAAALAEDRERCLAAGMDDYLTKPVTSQRLAEVLGRWVPSREADHHEPGLPTP